MTSSPHGPYILGYTRVTMAVTMGRDRASAAQALANPKKLPQFGLYSATRVHEAGIASNRGSERRGEYVPGSCTHRPSHHGSWFCLKPPLKSVHGRVNDWGEVVTR